jgi:hypothetical protein
MIILYYFLKYKLKIPDPLDQGSGISLNYFIINFLVNIRFVLMSVALTK